MFLRSLKLTNIRSVANLTLDFTRGDKLRSWTYLLGENGVGKSSVLKAIALVLAGSDAISDLIENPDDWIRLGVDKAAIEVVVQTKSGAVRPAALRFTRGESTSSFIRKNVEELDKLDNAFEHSERNYFVVGYGVVRHALKSARGGFEGLSSHVPTRVRAIATLFNLSSALVSLESWAMDLDYRRGESGLVAVRNALDNLLPEVTFKGIDRERRALMFNTSDGILPLSALSDGYQAMAAWCGDLLFQITETFEDYRDPLAARGLLLVDEIDLHLHPVWQRRLVSFIRETLPNVQVVVTTHSPLTVHQADAGELYVLKRTGDGVKAEHYLGAPNKLMLHQLLQSPLFGLETLDSPQIEQARQEIRDLQATGVTAATEERMAELKEKLEDVPTWLETRPGLERTNNVLAEIAAQLSSVTGTPVTLRDISRDEGLDFSRDAPSHTSEEGND